VNINSSIIYSTVLDPSWSKIDPELRWVNQPLTAASVSISLSLTSSLPNLLDSSSETLDKEPDREDPSGGAEGSCDLESRRGIIVRDIARDTMQAQTRTGSQSVLSTPNQ
jgi:hypothetical protein